MRSDRLLSLVSKMMADDFEEDDELDVALEELNRLVPAAHASDLIFHGDRNDTAEDIVEKMLAAKPIILHG